jgi:hypothetical protein
MLNSSFSIYAYLQVYIYLDLAIEDVVTLRPALARIVFGPLKRRLHRHFGCKFYVCAHSRESLVCVNSYNSCVAEAPNSYVIDLNNVPSGISNPIETKSSKRFFYIG